MTASFRRTRDPLRRAERRMGRIDAHTREAEPLSADRRRPERRSRRPETNAPRRRCPEPGSGSGVRVSRRRGPRRTEMRCSDPPPVRRADHRVGLGHARDRGRRICPRTRRGSRKLDGSTAEIRSPTTVTAVASGNAGSMVMTRRAGKTITLVDRGEKVTRQILPHDSIPRLPFDRGSAHVVMPGTTQHRSLRSAQCPESFASAPLP